MPTDDEAPCTQLQLLQQRMGQMERLFDQHCKAQNSHLSSIDQTLGRLTEIIGQNRNERSEQIGDLKLALEAAFVTLYQRAVLALIPIVGGLLYIILGHVLGK